MTLIGSVHGIRFCFDTGLLSGIQIEKHRKPVYSVKEQFKETSSLSISPVNQPYPILRDFGVELEQDYIPDSSTFLKTTQELGIGKRQIEVCQYRKSEKSNRTEKEPTNLVVASISILFDLTNTTTWRLVLSDINNLLESKMNRLELQTQNNVSIEFECTETIKVELETFGAHRNAHIQISLPQGTSKVQLKVISRPIFDFGDTVVICRPDQLREAAIVVSCLPADHFTPLIVLEPPPITEKEHQIIYKDFYNALTKQNEKVGTNLGMVSERGPDEIKELFAIMQDRNRLQRELTPLRSWSKYNKMLSYILEDLALKQVVFLFQPENYEIHILQEEDSHDPEIKFSLLPEDIQRIYFIRERKEIPNSAHQDNDYYCYSRLSELTELAWKRIGPTGQSPINTFDVPQENEALYLLGLPCALRERVPLRPVYAQIHSIEDACQIANKGLNSDEAVLIEDTGDASNVVGALYAHHRGASLIVSPAPNRSLVEQALASYLQKHEQASKALKYVLAHRELADNIQEFSDAEKSIIRSLPDAVDLNTDFGEFKKFEFIEGIRQYLLKDWQSDALKDIETTVSAQVPDYVLSGVGDRNLTVFTTGMPYSFVNKKSIDWSDKAIGHVVSDASLIILSEIYNKGAVRSPITFNLIFDPGFFQTSETNDVLRTLERHFTHSILLSKKTASLISLQLLPAELPVENIFFNTHGADNAILLGDMTLMDYNIIQWVTLKSWPIIFNNSCLSWIGVGQEFIRAGARGYIGTLWSIDAKSAANFAQTVMKRLTLDGAPVSEAIRKTGVNPFTERSYIYVGTSNARLDQWSESNLKGEKEYFLGALELLLKNLYILSGRLPEDYYAEIMKLLYREVKYFTERLEEISSDDSVDIIDASIKELTILGESTVPLSEDIHCQSKLISKCLDKLDKLQIPENMKLERRSLIYFLSGNIKWKHGQLDDAIADLRKSIEYEQLSGSLDGHQYLMMANIFKSKGLWEQAKKTALQARELFEKEINESGIVAALGVLGQLGKRLMEYDDAMEYIIEGYSRAVKLGNKKEQSIFKGDQAQIHMARNNYDEAIKAAWESIKISRTNHDDLSEFKAYGIIGLCYTEKGDISKAEKYTTIGLEKAQKIGDPIEEASFLLDLGKIKSLKGDIQAGLDCYRDSTAILLKHGNIELLIGVISETIDLSIRAGDWDLLFKTISHQIVICARFDEVFQGIIVSDIIKNIKKTINVAELEILQIGLRLLWQITNKFIDSNPKNISDHIRFIADVFYMFLLWLHGKKEAIERAHFLDQVSGGVLNLETYVALPYSKLQKEFHQKE